MHNHGAGTGREGNISGTKFQSGGEIRLKLLQRKICGTGSWAAGGLDLGRVSQDHLIRDQEAEQRGQVVLETHGRKLLSATN